MDEGRLHAYLDGAAGRDDAAEIERHLAGCAACRARLDDARALRERGRSLLGGGDLFPVEQPPFDAVVARARRAPAPAPRRRRYLAPAAWAASLVVALGAGWLARDLLRDGEPAPLARVETPAASAPVADRPSGTETAPPSPVEPPEIERVAVARAEEATADRAAPAAVLALESARAAAGDALGYAPAAEAAWTPADRAGAERHLGRPLAAVPDLPIAAIETGRIGDRAAVRVRQRLGDGSLTLLQLRAGEEPGRGVVGTGETEITVRHGDLTVTARAPLPADSIRALLERLR